MSLASANNQTQREAYRHKLMFELMFYDNEEIDLKRYIRAFVSLIYKRKKILCEIFTFLRI